MTRLILALAFIGTGVVLGVIALFMDESSFARPPAARAAAQPTGAPSLLTPDAAAPAPSPVPLATTAPSTQGPATAAGTPDPPASAPSQAPEESGDTAGAETAEQGGDVTIELEAAHPKAVGTAEALNAHLQAARRAESVAQRHSSIASAWVEYLSWAGRDGGESVRAAALDELVALYHGESDPTLRQAILDRVDGAGTEPIVQLMLEAARSGRTESERLSAIKNLGRFGQDGAVTDRSLLHPAAPDQVTAAREIATLRERARTELTGLQGSAQSDAEKEAIEFALKRLGAGEKR